MAVNNEILEIKNIILSTVDCEKIYLFGSCAYETPGTGSDYDFLCSG
ncbi:MAG: nucleotidyltransferase domain-containing protein [Treponema sp.]|nr:nucleotidyltransferase domain-containing protein [Treponema sp.]